MDWTRVTWNVMLQKGLEEKIKDIGREKTSLSELKEDGCANMKKRKEKRVVEKRDTKKRSCPRREH